MRIGLTPPPTVPLDHGRPWTYYTARICITAFILEWRKNYDIGVRGHGSGRLSINIGPLAGIR